MKRPNSLAALCFLALMLGTGSSQGQAKAEAGFDQLKTLLGEWEGVGEDGIRRTVSYQLLSGGTALMEILAPDGEPDMVTVYTVDGDHLALTHYCSANNQPRMKTEALSAVPQKLVFAFTGGTNLPSPDAHMVGLSVTFEDQDHFTQSWTWKEAGNDHVSTFRFTRRK